MAQYVGLNPTNQPGGVVDSRAVFGELPRPVVRYRCWCGHSASIFVSQNGGPPEPWLTNTVQTSATYAGVVGRSYAFYSIARDLTHNLEDPPSLPDARTMVSVCAGNTPPVLGTYAPVVMNPGTGATIAPTLPPSDNGTIISMTATAPGFAGTVSIDQVTGVVTIANAGPPGNYTISVTATDNCAAMASRTFTLVVNASRIAFASTRDGNSEIYVVNPDGSALTRLTNHAAADIAPVWSPDKSKIAFATNRHGSSNYEIYVMNADGTGQTRLTNHPAVDVAPAWSPNGTTIAFATNRHGSSNFEIYTMNATNGGGLMRLTTNAAVDGDPAWSPDGTRSPSRPTAMVPRISRSTP